MKKLTFVLGISVIVFTLSVTVVSCNKGKTPGPEPAPLEEPALPATAYEYNDKHGVGNDLATLGRVLFYDRKMSVNNSVACGSCHKQQFAFADNVRVNKGFNGQELTRNSPSIQGIRGAFGNGFQVMADPMTQNPSQSAQQDSRFKELLFWDGRQNSLVDMVLNPVLNHREMNIPDFPTLVGKLRELSYYPDLFQKAFGSPEITKEKIARALEGFIACLNTDNSMNPNLFNNTLNPDGSSKLTGIAEQGRLLFHNKYNCAKCHDQSASGSGTYGPATSPTQMFNIGLDEVYTDNGLGAITRKEGDRGVFKVPTLKNISVTAPYMHDGRFANLGQVIDHYSHEIKPNKNLSSQFIAFDGTPKKLNINASEKAALIAFLNTLKDEDFLTSPMYADPFKSN
jgi:cytochrome c peroxidase